MKKLITPACILIIFTLMTACGGRSNGSSAPQIVYYREAMQNYPQDEVAAAIETVRSMRRLYTEVMMIFRTSLLGGHGDISFTPEHGWESDVPIIEYEVDGFMSYFMRVNDPRLPHIQSTQDIRDHTETIFTREFAEEHFFQHFLGRVYIDVDGYLYRVLADGINSIHWITDVVTIADLTAESFTALTPIYFFDQWERERFYPHDTYKLFFVLTPEGWRINGTYRAHTGMYEFMQTYEPEGNDRVAGN